MSSNYQTYLDYLASFADSHTMAVEAERNIYPLFADLKKLIGHYEGTISKFTNVQNQLTNFIDKLNFDDNDFDYYQSLFKELRKVDGYLQELKTKQVPASISQQVQDFISDTYDNASLFNLENIEEQVLTYHNKAAEVSRYDKYQKDSQAQNTRNIIIGVIVVLVLIILIATCNH